MTGDRADAIPAEAVHEFLAAFFALGEAAPREQSVRVGLAAAVPLLPGGERVENARRIIDELWAEALMCDTAMLVDHVAVECRKALAALNGETGLVDPPPTAHPDAERAPQEDR